MSAVEQEQFEVGDLDAAGVLEWAATKERESRRVEVDKLELARQWAVLNPAKVDTGVATWGGAALDVLDADESLGGAGTPAVAAFTPETLAAAMETTPAQGMRLIADALDLHHRLPRLWRRVRRLEIPAWRARLAAQQTRPLSQAGALWVDEQLAARAIGFGGVVLDRLVTEAVARFDPEEHERREDKGKASWDVTISHPAPGDFAGTSELFVRGDARDLTRFHDLVCDLAAGLKASGDGDPLGARKAKALGVIADLADGRAALDLETLLGGPAAGTRADKIKVYVRVDASDLDVDAEGGSAFAVGDLERLGPATLAKIRAWVGHSRIVFQPVLDLARGDAVDGHDPPGWMRELVLLRDGHCVFPGCTRDARSCDLDHIEPYDDSGPPGQTSPHNLACLCRRHHRAKTLGLWRYTRTPTGHYLWHGSHGRSYLVTPFGTVAVPAC
jgi:Domain of unknown function (DUF222)